MRTQIHYIGVVDFDNTVHGVSLQDGLNLITGCSSTGKSSVMEIFDYCMGSEDDTIAEGVITEHAAVYFVDMSIKGIRYMIGRERHKNYYLLQIEKELSTEEKGKFFINQKSISRDDFLIQLGLLLGVDIENTKEADEDENLRGMAGRPSIRNMMPFLLQHQSLIANKLALFYRFDERTKKEQTIDQFKVFAGIVNTKYYDLKRRSNALEKRKKALDLLHEKHKSLCHNIYVSLCAKLEQYKQITGNDLFENFDETQVLLSPDSYLQILHKSHVLNIEIVDNNEQYQVSYAQLEHKLMNLQRQLRARQIELTKIESSIKHLEDYKNQLRTPNMLHEVQIDYSICPFCHQHTESVQKEARLLLSAYESVRKNIGMSSSLVRPQYEQKHKLENEIEELSKEMLDVRKNMAIYSDIISKLKQERSLQVQAYEVIVSVCSLLEEIADEPYAQSDYEHIIDELVNLNQQLSYFNVKRNLYEAETKINENIEHYRKYFPFESSLSSYKLRFNIDQFEIQFERGNEHIRLRSLGSGANWLGVHLCLFLAINKYLYDKQESCVPTVLFLDQPSQVYFPTFDRSNEFNAEQLHDNSGISSSLEDDLQAVENIFSVLYMFCQENPQFQIIVADHADKLNIKGLKDFESIVRARWRKHGEGLISFVTNASK